jgi:hypothetical protein
LSRVAPECSQEVSMHMALSNPCFELWLLLHMEDAASLPPEEARTVDGESPKVKKYRPIFEGAVASEDGFLS